MRSKITAAARLQDNRRRTGKRRHLYEMANRCDVSGERESESGGGGIGGRWRDGGTGIRSGGVVSVEGRGGAAVVGATGRERGHVGNGEGER